MNETADLSSLGLTPFIPSQHQSQMRNKKYHISLNENDYLYCIFCKIRFKNCIALQAHLSVFKHKKPFQTKAQSLKSGIVEYLDCRICGGQIYDSSLHDHKCVLGEMENIHDIAMTYNSNYSPLVCILCKSVPAFPSQARLQIHLVLVHSPMKYPYNCSLCNSKFRSVDCGFQESHAVDVHVPEMNLLYWNLMNERRLHKGKNQVKPPKYHCSLSFYHNKSSMANCDEKLENIFDLTLHTICYHGYLNKNVILPRLQSKNLININELDDSENSLIIRDDNKVCKYCNHVTPFPNQLNDHIGAIHINELKLRQEFINKKGLLINKITLNLTCLLCMQIFKSNNKLQLHILVNHSSKMPFHCGLCDKPLVDLGKSTKLEYIDRMNWISIKYHEKMHFRQYRHYLNTGKFNESLIPEPQLYQSLSDFIEKLEAERSVDKGPLFTDVQYQFLKSLGEKNYENQVQLEMNNHL